jgi:hypothetical protein
MDIQILKHFNVNYFNGKANKNSHKINFIIIFLTFFLDNTGPKLSTVVQIRLIGILNEFKSISKKCKHPMN